MLRGAFINTAKAICSIFESGEMVFDCLKSSKRYTLDYITLDQIDIAHLRERRELKLLNTARAEGVPNTSERNGNGAQHPAEHPSREPGRGDYDFWVFNYHPNTMAPTLPRDLLPYFKGPKFAIVLEVEPDNPIKFVPAADFDSCMVLDPTAIASAKVTPFPRPLRGTARRGRPTVRPVPIIGSFGLGTPGKGFEQVVEAVNREFDRALVRVNVPPASHVDPIMFKVHQMKYIEYIGKLCKKIARPGIEIEFTDEFFDGEQLVDWCGENDLNCFMYTRRQSGLSATTDQCVISGQPLIVSSNDTFRHIHPYIAPYPKLSLREAMRTTGPAVRQMQEDWSIDSFQKTFYDMLLDHGVVAKGQAITTVQPRKPEKPRRIPTTVVLATTEQRSLTDPVSYVARVAAAIGRTGEYRPLILSYRDATELQRGLFWMAPAAVILCGTIEGADVPAVLEPLAIPLFHLPITVGQALAADSIHLPPALENRIQRIERGLTIPYFTALPPLPPGPPRICLMGVRGPGNVFELILSKIQRERPDAHVLVAKLPGESAEHDDCFAKNLKAARSRLKLTPAMQIIEINMPGDAHHIIHLAGTFHLNVIADDGVHSDLLMNFAELIMTTERATVFTKLAPFAGLKDVPFLEDAQIDALVKKGAGVQSAVYNRCCEWSMYTQFDRLYRPHAQVAVRRVSWTKAAAGTATDARSWPSPSGVLLDDQAAWLKTSDRLGDIHDPDLAWADDHMAAYVTTQQQFLVAAVERLCGGVLDSRIVGFGDKSRSSVTVLGKLGYELTTLDEPTAELPAESADCVFSSCTLSGLDDARDLLTRAISGLKPGGGGVFTFFQREPYAMEDDRENPDFPVIPPESLANMARELGVTLAGPVRWQSPRPVLQPRTFSAPQLATIVFRKAAAARG